MSSAASPLLKSRATGGDYPPGIPWFRRSLCLLLSSLFPLICASSPANGLHEYCTSEKFDARCLEGEIILVQEARYGRMQAGRCISAEYAHTMGCYADVTAHLDEMCTGRQNCSSHVGTLDSVAQPCSKDFKAYLEASYKCVKVSYVDDCTHKNHTRLTAKSGYIALKSQNNQWNAICPWRVKTEPGRLINISGVNFGAIRDQNGPVLHKITPCPFYVAFSEENHSKTQSLCYIENKRHVLYSSRTNRVDVKLIITKTEMEVWKKFRPVILYYRVHGCVDLTPPEGAKLTRDGENALITCNETQEKWYLTCRDGTWIGEAANCSKASDLGRVATIASDTPVTLHNGLILAVLIGVVLGVVVGGMMLFVIFLMRKSRRTRRQSRRGEESQYETRMRSGGVDDNNCSYPALLCQEKPCGAHVCEYTHVWNMHPSSMACTGDMAGYTYERPPKQKPDILSDRDKKVGHLIGEPAVEKIHMTNFTVADTRLKEPPPGFYDLDTTELSMASSMQRVPVGATLPRNVNCPRVHMEPPIEPL